MKSRQRYKRSPPPALKLSLANKKLVPRLDLSVQKDRSPSEKSMTSRSLSSRSIDLQELRTRRALDKCNDFEYIQRHNKTCKKLSEVEHMWKDFKSGGLKTTRDSSGSDRLTNLALTANTLLETIIEHSAAPKTKLHKRQNSYNCPARPKRPNVINEVTRHTNEKLAILVKSSKSLLRYVSRK